MRNSESQRIDASSLIFNFCMLCSPTTALSTLCQGRPYLHMCIYIYIYVYIYIYIYIQGVRSRSRDIFTYGVHQVLRF